MRRQRQRRRGARGPGARGRFFTFSPRPDTMSGISRLNANAETMGAKAALALNVGASGGLMDVMKTNLGPRGTIKMLVSGAGDIKLTKVRRRRAPGAGARRPAVPRQRAESERRARFALCCAGRQCAAARDADPEPHGHHDRAHRRGAGRHHRVRVPGGAARILGLATADRQLCRRAAALWRVHCGCERAARRAALCCAAVRDKQPGWALACAACPAVRPDARLPAPALLALQRRHHQHGAAHRCVPRTAAARRARLAALRGRAGGQ